ncbi:Uncharacterised protein [Rhodococcus erythropolis]|nr:hypothetical protein [Rhodococcus erythropolis]SUE10995.1 Uncharacterised protein [Rhodococcus erythropolis]
MFNPTTELFGISAQLTGTETDCALVDLMTDLHACEAMLVERKLAVIAEFFSRQTQSMPPVVRGRRPHTSWLNRKSVRH